ncbi:hypothetical protein [Streptomyces colonosanans]|uniref:Uncharacterized protein n=1 Tax=Streptomyces colonosanans TaxID=1428652 RepID=A0A1S2NU55_9ACTN|nr:hypothetical protein [Streptomyces colonosanans]OIJ84755.1 hypothetical protein BIV24_30285 [Streptomyces colonosanans]
MAHAAPASGTPRTPATRLPATVAAQRPPNLFDRRTHAAGRVAVPVVVGLVYGYWAATTRRRGGPLTGWNIGFGFLTALVFAAVCIGLFLVAPRLRREQHATLWAAFAGIALGFLFSQSGHSVFSSAGLGLVFAAAVFLFNFYRYYTHEKLQRPQEPAG